MRNSLQKAVNFIILAFGLLVVGLEIAYPATNDEVREITNFQELQEEEDLTGATLCFNVVEDMDFPSISYEVCAFITNEERTSKGSVSRLDLDGNEVIAVFPLIPETDGAIAIYRWGAEIKEKPAGFVEYLLLYR